MESNVISVKKLIKEMKTDEFVLGCRMDSGYSVGLPILQIRNGILCLVLPYLRYRVTGEVDKTLVYPIRYTVTVELPGQKPVAFQDLSIISIFEKVDFTRPVGLFRHDSIKQYGKDQYFALKDELYSLYDKTANALIYETSYTWSDEKRMVELLRLLIEPSLLPMYKALDIDFYNKYLKREEANEKGQ